MQTRQNGGKVADSDLTTHYFDNIICYDGFHISSSFTASENTFKRTFTNSSGGDITQCGQLYVQVICGLNQIQTFVVDLTITINISFPDHLVNFRLG